MQARSTKYRKRLFTALAMLLLLLSVFVLLWQRPATRIYIPDLPEQFFGAEQWYKAALLLVIFMSLLALFFINSILGSNAKITPLLLAAAMTGAAALAGDPAPPPGASAASARTLELTSPPVEYFCDIDCFNSVPAAADPPPATVADPSPGPRV